MVGVEQRFSTFVRVIARLAHRVDLLHFVPDHLACQMPPAAALSSQISRAIGCDARVNLAALPGYPKTFWNYYGAGILSARGYYYYRPLGSARAGAAISALMLDRPDLVFVHRLGAMCALFASGSRPANMFFDLDDLEHKVLIRSAREARFGMGTPLLLAQAPAMLAAEIRAARMSRLTFVCSEQDRRRMTRLGLRSRIAVVPNGIHATHRPDPLVAEPTLLFVGTCQYPPNFHAAERLVSRIWPLVHARVPQARLFIAGSGSERIPSARAAPAGVSVLGQVADLEELYGRSRLVTCPLMVGGGTRIKIIEGAMYAKPIVSTTIGAEGLAFEDGRDILLRDDDQGFADACVRLLSDDATADRLRCAARDRARALYDSAAIEARITEMIQKAMPQVG